MTTTLRLAARGPTLARAQATSVQGALTGRRFDIGLVEVGTMGNRIQGGLIHRLGKTGAFARTFDERILDGEINAMVYSMRGMPTEKPADLVVAGVSERAPAGDMFVTAEGHDIDDLSEGTVVGTSSLRRQTQLPDYRDDLEVELLWGDTDTCTEKLLATHLRCGHGIRVENDKERQSKKGKTNHDEASNETVDEWFEGLIGLERQALSRQVETEYGVVVLAGAGLRRNELTEKVNYERLPQTTPVPAPRQGITAVTVADSAVIELIRDKLNHPQTRVETTVERTILAELGGSCTVPVGVYTFLQGEHVHVDMQILMTDGSESIKASRDLPVGNHANTAREFVAVLCDRDAGQLIGATREKTEE